MAGGNGSSSEEPGEEAAGPGAAGRAGPALCAQDVGHGLGAALKEKRPHSSSLARGLVFGLFHINGASSCG